MKRKKDKVIRSLAKTLSWRVTATAITMILVFAFTRKIGIALGVGLIDAALKTTAYYLHERGWNATEWGKHK